jgi:UDPglucose 6-dehydrogenase
VKSREKPAIGVFGAGWVGLVTGACFAELGHDVVVRDVLPERIEALQAGRLPLHEPGLAELLERNRERLTFTTELDEVVSAPVMFVCVGTPPTYSGDADLSAVWTVVDHLPALEERAILVMKSTVPVGTGEKVRAALDARGLAHVGYVSNPEFLSEGSAVKDFMSPDRLVVGAFTEADAGTVAALYEPLEAPMVQADVASAEMIKLAANAFLMTRISFINEIANVCEATGADVEQVAKGIGLDHRLGPHFLRAGIGWGGSCFPKDGVALKQLASNSGYHFQLLNAVIEVNELQKRRVIGKLEKHLGKLRGKTIALLGLAFKPNTDDLRDSPSLDICKRLAAEGAIVSVHDPVAMPNAARGNPDFRYADSVHEAARDAEVVLHLTEWADYRAIDPAAVGQVVAQKVLVDGRSALDADAWHAAGWSVHRPGQPPMPAR